MTDTAEYWNDVKSNLYRMPKHVYVHYKGFECGHYHVDESRKLLKVDCPACLDMITKDCDLNLNLEQQRKQQSDSRERQMKINKGYKLSSHIKFGKYKLLGKTIRWVIENDSRYFKWMLEQRVILLHPEVDEFLTTNQL